ncbi:MAG: hypothetical protein QXO37_02485 [Candidatus Nitrosocaldaceae archaeon]
MVKASKTLTITSSAVKYLGLWINPTSVPKGNTFNTGVNVTDTSDSPVANLTVYFRILDSSGVEVTNSRTSAVTGSDGKAFVTYDTDAMAVGTYTVEASDNSSFT